jgi:hypothetical protein
VGFRPLGERLELRLGWPLRRASLVTCAVPLDDAFQSAAFVKLKKRRFSALGEPFSRCARVLSEPVLCLEGNSSPFPSGDAQILSVSERFGAGVFMVCLRDAAKIRG